MTAEGASVLGRLRAAGLLSDQVAERLADDNGVCLRPVMMRRLDGDGTAETVAIRCGSVAEAACPPCARRARSLRVQQCREGWHVEDEPVRDRPAPDGVSAAQGRAGGGSADEGEPGAPPRRNRSTRRRQDTPDLPRRARRDTTLGRVYATRDGKRLRPSMFVTLTLPSYGRIRGGVPADPAAYDYTRAVRDAIHFSKLVDRFVQNLRRIAGYSVQYFAVVEPQRRGAPHLHMAVRGTISRADLRAVVAATYHQVWWPPVDVVRFEGDRLPVWAAGAGGAGDYCDPSTGEALPTWDQALDALGDDAEPLHVVRFGTQLDAKGVLAGSVDADQTVRYLTKYLTKSLGGDRRAETLGVDRAAHVARLVEALRYEPCSPTCANWLRYGVQPKSAKAGLLPGRCRGRAHKASHLGYGGRRVLVSRRWSGKTLADHAADRRAWVLAMLGLPDATGTSCDAVWMPVPAGDPLLPPRAVVLLRQVAAVQLLRARLRALDTEGGL
ncbi:replication initiator [Sinosporangium siamense]|uniref:Replication initiation protein n=1 Tax=Sinosporangium siamense TaxID=1367973 RepID=A0A919VGP8_9ACTN|nr:replication initiator [Sinosporangium siamense]GII97324.1 hypothetical protein Ssi02_75550 [Sinosporangium siamense]